MIVVTFINGTEISMVGRSNSNVICPVEWKHVFHMLSVVRNMIVWETSRRSFFRIFDKVTYDQLNRLMLLSAVYNVFVLNKNKIENQKLGN